MDVRTETSLQAVDPLGVDSGAGSEWAVNEQAQQEFGDRYGHRLRRFHLGASGRGGFTHEDIPPRIAEWNVPE